MLIFGQAGELPSFILMIMLRIKLLFHCCLKFYTEKISNKNDRSLTK